MTYIRQNKTNRPKIFIYGSIVFIVVIFVLIRTFFPHFFPALFTSIAVPFWRAEFSIGSGSLSSPAYLLRENEDLRRQLVENNVRMDLVEYLEAENARLRSLFSSASSTQNILVAILKRPPVAPYDELIIDAGYDDQISSSSIVYSIGNIPIGQVAEVMDNASKVILFSSPGQKHNVLIGDKNFPALAIGRGGGQYEAELPASLEVKEGDFVVSASVDAKPVGRVTYVDNSTSLPFKKILFSPLVNIYELRWVFVGTKNK